jgi:uncharacterized protein with HEPN domain
VPGPGRLAGGERSQLSDYVRIPGPFQSDCIQAGWEEFFANVVYQDAVMRNLEIIGEAAKRISPELRGKLDLPWRRIAGLRDALIDDYPNLDLERIWLVASRDVPELL